MSDIPEDLKELKQQALAELCHFDDKWPKECIALIERIAALTAERDGMSKWKEETIESLQDICDEHGCPCGWNRFDFLRSYPKMLKAERDEMKRQRDVFALGLEAEEKDCAAAEAERDRQYEFNVNQIAKHAELEAERDALEAKLNALQEAWRMTVGDGTDKITPAGLKSLIEDYSSDA